ncbi:MAG: peptide deformylase [Candidatus Kerfeldbacteria bacterium]|nr:peptide deformylase [Candidatus Kerfeldbacteria bacterium]
MAVLPITKLGNPILRQISRTVDPADIATAEFRRLVKDMTETMFDANGIGIAAPQVNVGLQVAIINAKDDPFPIINPVIIKRSIRKNSAEEGCLSIPGVFGIAPRPSTVTVRYLDRRGAVVTQELSGLFARVFQHEIDHLNGKLFIDRAKKISEGSLT